MKYEEIKLDSLSKALVKKIKERKDFFSPLTIVVPGVKTAQYFKSYWLKHENEILMNVSFVSLNEVLYSLTSKRKFNIQAEQLKLYVLESLTQRPNNYKEIEDYISDDVRLYDMADKLTNLFLDYINDCYEFTGWQKELFDEVMLRVKEKSFILDEEAIDKINDDDFKENLIFFGFTEFNPLQEKFIKKFENKIELYKLKKGEGQKAHIFSAPSALREIEIVHSKICQILNQNKDSSYSDFLILAPKIEEYSSIVKRVFEQDNVEFPALSYACCQINTQNNDSLFVINKLSEIKNKGFFTRKDFFELVNNPLVQKIRAITKEDADAWLKAIVDLNITRQRESFDDWQYLKIRLLLSKFVEQNDVDENIVKLGNDKYLPYRGITMDDNSIFKFIKMIDDLKTWTMLDQQNNAEENILEKLKDELEKWLSLKDKYDQETNYAYLKVLKAINEFDILNIKTNKITFNIFINVIVNELEKVKFNEKELFTNGITFTSFDERCVLSAKYVFLIGANSDVIPQKKVDDELDLRGQNNKNELDSLYIQLQNADEFYVSYISRDLETDAELYPATFINEIKNGEIETYKIDGDLKWSDLFTKREFKNKKHYEGLFVNREEVKTKLNEYLNKEGKKKIKLSSMEKFLKEPLSQKANEIFGKTHDNEKKLADEFENFDIDKITKYNVKIAIIKDLLNGKINKEGIKEKLLLENILPRLSKEYDEAMFEKLYQEADEAYKFMNEEGEVEYVKLDDLKLSNDETKECTIEADISIFRSVNENNRKYFDIPYSNDKPKLRNYIKQYVFALLDIVSLDETEYDVSLYCGNISKHLILNPELARTILVKIYQAMNDYSNNFLMTTACLEKEDIMDIEKLIEDLEKDTDWKYFENKHLFDYRSQIGYDAANFKDEFEANVNFMKEMLGPLMEKK